MLEDDLKTQLKAYLERLQRPVVLVASVDDGAKSVEMLELLEDIRALSDKVSVEVSRDDAHRKPSFAVTSPGHDIDLRFAGLPWPLVPSLVLARLQVVGLPRSRARAARAGRRLEAVPFETFARFLPELPRRRTA